MTYILIFSICHATWKKDIRITVDIDVDIDVDIQNFGKMDFYADVVDDDDDVNVDVEVDLSSIWMTWVSLDWT